MTRERIEDMREVVLPFVKKRLLEINYEGLGEADAEEFEKEFNAILDLAIKALEQEPTTKNDLGVDLISRVDLYNRIKGIDHYEDCEGSEHDGSLITYNLCDWDEVLREIEDASSVTPQEPIIDKIRAEIEEHAKINQNLNTDRARALCWCLDVIDKYKAERSEEE